MKRGQRSGKLSVGFEVMQPANEELEKSQQYHGKSMAGKRSDVYSDICFVTHLVAVPGSVWYVSFDTSF